MPSPISRARTLRVAILAPISWRVPPRGYGPWEQFASLLTEGLVERYAAWVRQSADLIGMATAGHHGFLDALRGSTTERVIRQAPCPVLTIRRQLVPPWRAADAV